MCAIAIFDIPTFNDNGRKTSHSQTGVNYPDQVEITEEVEYDGKKVYHVKILGESYVVGMYTAFYIDGKFVSQSGDHDNKKCVGRLIRDIKAAIKRGAIVEIGSILPIKRLEKDVVTS